MTSRLFLAHLIPLAYYSLGLLFKTATEGTRIKYSKILHLLLKFGYKLRSLVPLERTSGRAIYPPLCFFRVHLSVSSYITFYTHCHIIIEISARAEWLISREREVPVRGNSVLPAALCPLSLGNGLRMVPKQAPINDQ